MVPASAVDAGGTRERILDVALERFTRKGYAETSLREIAEELGVSKAALYYHFASKQDILLALHLRMHALEAEFGPLASAPDDPGTWAALLDRLIGIAIRHRRLIELHFRNPDAVQQLHSGEMLERHGSSGEGLEAQVLRFVASPAIDPEVRVRRVVSLGAIVSFYVGAAALSDIDDEDFERLLRKVTSEILVPR